MAIRCDAEILSNVEVAPGHFCMTLNCPELARAAQPGQFVHVRCGPHHDPFLRRPLSVADVSDDRAGLSLLVRQVGRGTEILAGMAPGHRVDVIGPLGNGYDLEVNREGREFVLVAGGYGVAPIHFAARRLREMRKTLAEPRITIFAGASTAERVVLLSGLKRAADDVHVATEDGSRGHHGLVTAPLERYLDTAGIGRVLTCGPTAMMAAAWELCRSRGMSCQASLENWMGCGVGACLGCVVPVRGLDSNDGFRPIERGRLQQPEEPVVGGGAYRRVCRDGPVFDAADVAWESLP